MDLSIVIPAYDEQAKIQHDIKAAAEFIVANRFSGEIIVVDDGSRDQTAEVAKQTKICRNVLLKVIRYEKNCGKGFAVRTGMLASSGNYVLFADSGLCTPYRFVLDGLQLLRQNDCEQAHGSRKLPQSKIVIPQTFQRRISAKLFHWLVISFMGIPQILSDTQCGFKIYRGDVARELYKECFSNGFMFDIEIILRALQKGYRIKEFPIEWRADRDSRLSMSNTLIAMFYELNKINKRLRQQIFPGILAS